MVYAQKKFILENEKILRYFEISNRLYNSDQKAKPSVNYQEKRCHNMDFAAPADYKVKKKESKKIDKYLNLAREQKKLWFGLVSLFNGISIFVGYLTPKPFSKKNSSGTI